MHILEGLGHGLYYHHWAQCLSHGRGSLDVEKEEKGKFSDKGAISHRRLKLTKKIKVNSLNAYLSKIFQ